MLSLLSPGVVAGPVMVVGCCRCVLPGRVTLFTNWTVIDVAAVSTPIVLNVATVSVAVVVNILAGAGFVWTFP